MIASRPCISTRRLSSSWEISLVKMRWPNEKRGGSRHSAWRRSEQTQRNPIVDGSIIRCVTATSVSSGTGAERSGARGHGEEHVSVSPVLRRRPGAVSLCLKGDRCGDGSWHGGELSTKGHHHYCTTTTFAYSWRHLIRCASLMELYYRIGTGRHQNFRHPFRCYRPINSLVPQSQKYALVWLMMYRLQTLKYWRGKKNQPGGISFTVHKCYSFQKASS